MAPVRISISNCIFVALSLLCAHAGTLSFGVYDELYNKMAWWQSFHQAQVEFDSKQCDQGKVKNYNNEFLIAYARDLISCIPSDQTVASNVATRMAAAAAALSHAVSLSLLHYLICSILKKLLRLHRHSKPPFNVNTHLPHGTKNIG